LAKFLKDAQDYEKILRRQAAVPTSPNKKAQRAKYLARAAPVDLNQNTQMTHS